MFKMYANILSSRDKEEGDGVVTEEGAFFPLLFPPVILLPPSGDMRQTETSTTVLGSNGSPLPHSLNPSRMRFLGADRGRGPQLGTGRSSQSRDVMGRQQRMVTH